MSEIRTSFYMNVSADEESRKAGEAVRVKVTAVFKDWTPAELVERLVQANSVRVAVQAVLRGKKAIPTTFEYIVPKPGTRSIQPVSIEELWATMTPAQREEFIAGKLAKAEAVMEAGAEDVEDAEDVA